MRQAVIILGPTAVGKTAVTTKLLPEKGVLVNADSRQVYRDMDLGTGKDIPDWFCKTQSGLKWRERKLVVYKWKDQEWWGFDLIKPNEAFSAGHFLEVMRIILADLWRRGKLPFIVSGTGFYLKSLYDPAPSLGIAPNEELRRLLAKNTVEELQAQLEQLNPTKFNSLNKSDQLNPRRLVRAIEVTGSPTPPIAESLIETPCLIGLQANFEDIENKITLRVKRRANDQMTQEIQRLEKKYDFWRQPVASTAIGYREWQSYLLGSQSKEQVITQWTRKERQYAKRQLTWFKKQPQIKWFSTTEDAWEARVAAYLKSWYGKLEELQ